MQQSFGSAYRLDRSAQYRRVFRRGRTQRCGPFTVRHLPNGGPHPRLGLVVPKRRVPKATQRNRIKRMIRESFRTRRAALPACDIVVQVSAPITDATRDEITETLAAAWRTLQRSA